MEKDESSEEIAADLLVVNIGQVPDLRGVAGWDLPLGDCHQTVNPAMETSIPGVFAVGDFATYPGEPKMIVTAVAEGSTAAATVKRFLTAGGLRRSRLVPPDAFVRHTETPAPADAARTAEARVSPSLRLPGCSEPPAWQCLGWLRSARSPNRPRS